MSLERCPRCLNGQILHDSWEPYCLQCGYRPYTKISIGEIVSEMTQQYQLRQPNVKPLVKTATIQEWDL